MSTDNATTPSALAAGTGSPVVAISIRQPWAWLILNAGKDIENRTWITKFRGRALVHAAKGMTRKEYRDAKRFVSICVSSEIALPSFYALLRGGIVGEVEITDCVDFHESSWFSGPYGFVLHNPKPLPFRPCRGSLGFFKIDEK